MVFFLAHRKKKQKQPTKLIRVNHVKELFKVLLIDILGMQFLPRWSHLYRTVLPEKPSEEDIQTGEVSVPINHGFLYFFA